jgi:hypothetical protein
MGAGTALRSRPPIPPGVRERTAEWSKPVKGASEFGCHLVWIVSWTLNHIPNTRLDQVKPIEASTILTRIPSLKQVRLCYAL